MTRPRLLISILCFAFLFYGCADEAAPASHEIDPTQSWSQIVMHRDLNQGPDAPWRVEAWFAKYRGVSDDAVRQAMDIIHASPEGCMLIPGNPAGGGDATIRFLATGAAQVRDDAGNTWEIAPHSLALQTDAISGVIYAATIEPHDTSTWHVRITNADGSPRLNIQEAVPNGWGVVAINGHNAFANPYRLPSDRALKLRIDTDAQSNIIVLRSRTHPDRAQLVCGMTGTEIILAPAQLDSVAAPGETFELSVIMRNGAALEQSGEIIGRANVELRDELTIIRTH